MTLSIYQTQPRLVFSSGSKVYKFFNLIDECKLEVETILSSPMDSTLDLESKYIMSFVEIISSHDTHYVMKSAGGESLTSSNDYSGYYLAGRWLRTFHDSSKASVKGDVFLFGDYVASHLYIDNYNKTVTLIDPGKGFGSIGKIEEDIARFVVGLFHTRNFNISKLSHRLSQFINGYGVDAVDYYLLDRFVKFRIQRSFEKSTTLNLNTGFKNTFIAFVWRTIENFKHTMVKNKLRGMLDGD